MPNGKNKRGCFIGLTGGIGSGKSTVLSMLKQKGAFTIDADAIVHDLLRNDRQILRKIRRRFGIEVFHRDGTLDRKKLGKKIFTDLRGRRYLESLIHPKVRRQMQILSHKNSGRIKVADVPLLYESGLKNKFDAVIVVNANLKNRLARLKSKGLAGSDVKNRIKAQWPLEKKVQLADYVVDNNRNKTQTRKQINMIWKTIITRSGEGA